MDGSVGNSYIYI